MDKSTIDIMELYLSKQEYEIIQFAVIAWGAFHCWDSLVNFSQRFPNTRNLIRDFMNGQQEEPPPQNNAHPADQNAQGQPN